MVGTCIVYWQPGCTSCLKTKEFLRAHGIEFEAVNVRETPGAMDALASLGIRSVPAVVRGTTFVLGQDLDEVARFVGVRLERERLATGVLAARVLALLDCAAVFTRRIPGSALGKALPGRKRTYLDLAYHVPQVVVALLDACAGGCLTYEHFNRKPPERLRSAAEAAAVTQQVARSFGAWWAANAGAPPLAVDTYYGRQPFHAVLERTAWHVAQHVRQLERVIALVGAGSPDARLPPELLEGLPLPAEVWDAEVPLG